MRGLFFELSFCYSVLLITYNTRTFVFPNIYRSNLRIAILNFSKRVIVIPKEHEEAVLAQAEKIEAAEEKIRAALEKGMRLDEAREINKYHSLQTKED